VDARSETGLDSFCRETAVWRRSNPSLTVGALMVSLKLRDFQSEPRPSGSGLARGDRVSRQKLDRYSRLFRASRPCPDQSGPGIPTRGANDGVTSGKPICSIESAKMPRAGMAAENSRLIITSTSFRPTQRLAGYRIAFYNSPPCSARRYLSGQSSGTSAGGFAQGSSTSASWNH
jgi:hypothetical protein